MIITKPWADEQNNDPSFLADIWQVQMIATLAIAILFMLLGNSIPIDGGKNDSQQVKTTIKMEYLAKEAEKPPAKINVTVKKTAETSIEEKKTDKPTQKDKKKKEQTSSVAHKQKNKEPFALAFENNDTLYYLMAQGDVRLFILIPELRLQYRAIYKRGSDFDFKPEAELNGFIYELTGTSVPPVLSKSFRTYSPGLAKKRLIYLIQVEKKLDKGFKKAFTAGKGRFVITKDRKTIKRYLTTEVH